jgi:YVTN family beta-propeller protein
MAVRNRNAILALAVLAAGAAALGAGLHQGPPVLLAYVADAGNNCVQVVDLATGETLRRIYSGATPWRLTVSPDRSRLWVQHWYSGTTAVIGLDDHEIVQVLPFRGPGAFNPAGDRFFTFDWPGSGLTSVDARTFERREERVTEVPKVYDLSPAPDGKSLYLVQSDPMAKGPRERYAYALAYPLEGSPSQAVPASLRTGLSPVAVHALRSGPFLLTADSETNGLTLLNNLGDGRAVPTCPAPRALVLSPDESTMAVACWRGDGARQSRVVIYRTDFTARPWPTITQTGTATVDGAVVAGSFSPDGSRLFFVDRTGNRLLEADPSTLKLVREIPTGDLPVDVAVAAVSARARERLAGKSRARQQVEPALARLREAGTPVSGFSWVETSADGRRLKAALRPPDRFRLETGAGARLAADGDTLSIEPGGRFWVSPRQELVAIVYALPWLSTDEAVRRLAGDVPGSPWLRAGIALDVAAYVEDGEEGSRSLLIGALRAGERVSQLRIDLASGRPARLTEQLPVFRSGGHGQAPGGLVETWFKDWTRTADGAWMPARLERVLDGRLRQEVRIGEVRSGAGLPEAMFDLARLDGTGIAPRTGISLTRDVPAVSPPYLADPREPHAPYSSDPPTSGPRLPYLADWGVHRLPVPPELQAHNLEHGGVAIQYNCPEACPDLAAELEGIARERDFVLVAPYPRMEARIALTAWGRIETLDGFDREEILRFVDAHAGQDHHASGPKGGQLARAH